MKVSITLSVTTFGTFQFYVHFDFQVIQHEGVCCVEFVDSFALKGDHMLNSTLFIGTTLGSVIIVIINLPDRGDPRTNEPVVVSPSGSLMRIRGPMLTMGFLDSSSAGLTTRNGEQLENVRAPARPHSTSPPAGAGKEEIPPTGDQQVKPYLSPSNFAYIVVNYLALRKK
jgi:hypothetical protein